MFAIFLCSEAFIFSCFFFSCLATGSEQTFICTYVCLCVFTCICVYVNVCLYVCMYLYLCILLYGCSFVCIYVFMFICVCVFFNCHGKELYWRRPTRTQPCFFSVFSFFAGNARWALPQFRPTVSCTIVLHYSSIIFSSVLSYCRIFILWKENRKKNALSFLYWSRLVLYRSISTSSYGYFLTEHFFYLLIPV